MQRTWWKICRIRPWSKKGQIRDQSEEWGAWLSHVFTLFCQFFTFFPPVFSVKFQENFANYAPNTRCCYIVPDTAVTAILTWLSNKAGQQLQAITLTCIANCQFSSLTKKMLKILHPLQSTPINYKSNTEPEFEGNKHTRQHIRHKYDTQQTRAELELHLVWIYTK